MRDIFFDLSVRSVRLNFLRSLLASIGIVIGVVAISSMGMLGTNMQLMVKDQLTTGINTIVITPDVVRAEPGAAVSSNTGITESQLREIRDAAGTNEVIPIDRTNTQFSIGSNDGRGSIYGLDPDDIIQDIRIKIWKLINDERPIFRQASYIKKIVNSAVIDQFRKLRREDGLFRHEKQKCVAELNPSYNREAARKKMFAETVGRAVERLIDTRRQVVKLYLLDFSIPEISSYLNWSTDKTRNLLYRGLADLRKSLKDCDVKHETRG